MRCSHAELRMLAVVVLWGVASPMVGFEATTRDVSGERRGALVPFGSARRATARDLGLGVVIEAEVCEELGAGVMTPLAAGSAIRPIALGVGVAGGCGMDFCVRLFGVDGVSTVSAVGEVFLLRV